MSKKSYKSQASSSRAFTSGFGAQAGSNIIEPFEGSSKLGAITSSPLSYVYEPPELSKISEPNVIVILKNLQKKDAVTKFKALEELQSHFVSVGTEEGRVEESILEAWVKIYPRITIDSARQVRRLAHLVQGQISVSFGKRVARYMKQVVGPWLAGLFDNDKSVSHAASDSLKRVFPSEEKMKSVWNIYMSFIVQFAIDSITRETPQTLSDERTTKPDDAASKYARVVGSMISMVAGAIEENATYDHIKRNSSIQVALQERRVWEFAADDDPFVRRSVYRLAVVAARNVKEFLDLSLISATILKMALPIQQSGSAFDYARALTTLTSETPEIWSALDRSSTQKSACRRLCEFLKKGSQAGPPEFWDQIASLLKQLPPQILLNESENRSAEDISTFPVLEAVRAGVVSADEPRGNHISAWNALLDIAALFIFSASSQRSRENIAEKFLVPMIEEYVKPSSHEAQGTIARPKNEDMCVKAVQQVFIASPEKVQALWSHISHNTIEDIENDSQKRGVDASKSEDSIYACIIRWNDLQTAVFRSAEADSLKSLISRTVISELNKALQVLEEKFGETLSAAILLKHALKMPQDIFRRNGAIMASIVKFAQQNIPRLLLSLSATCLIEILLQLADVFDIDHLCEVGITALRQSPDSAAKFISLQSFTESSFLARASESHVLKMVLKESLELALNGEESKWELIVSALNNPAAPKDLIEDILMRMTASLLINEETIPSLHGLKLIFNRRGQVIKASIDFSGISKLLFDLLLLAESHHDELAGKARELSVNIESCFITEKGSDYAVETMIEIIHKGLDSTGPESFSVDSLVQYARRLLNQSTASDRASLLATLLPNTSQWTRIMMPLMFQPPPSSLSPTLLLGGAISLIDSKEALTKHPDATVRDYSLALRAADYTTKLIRGSSLINISLPDQLIMIKSMIILHHVLQYRIVSLERNSLTRVANLGGPPSEFLNDLVDIIKPDDGDEKESKSKSSFLSLLKQKLLNESRGTTPASYYSACAFLFLDLRYGRQSTDENLGLGMEEADPLVKSSDMFRTVVRITVTADEALILQVLNEVLANLIGYEFETQPDIVLRQLVLLNRILCRKGPVLITQVPKQRLVLFVKHSASQMHSSKLSIHVMEEVLRAWSDLLSFIKDVYDSFWDQIIEIMHNVLSTANGFLHGDKLLLFNAVLELVNSLRILQRLEESNDDLKDAWIEKEALLLDQLLDLFKECQGVSYESGAQVETAALLGRQLVSFAPKLTGKLTELYGVLACQSTEVQMLAYSLLHYQIPKAQGQISLDKALESDFLAKLPDELLSLIIIMPCSDEIYNMLTYLLSWKLVFDHWTDASEKIRVDYAAGLKEESYLQSFLDFIFRILISDRAKPFDASTMQKNVLDLNSSVFEKDGTQKILVHLYFLSLKCVPNLCRSWWRDATSRQIAIAVESWTEKYISPEIITSELEAINAWAPSQLTAEQPMEIKVSSSTREITASIPIDEQSLQISIRFPPSYPLARPSVESLRRVAVDEKKWRGWLIATQGVINFTADGGQPIIEGLLAWRRNVTATLKGQTECAICYSVVGGDRQLPSKRCGTCKNCFHGSCLFKWFKSSNSSSCPLCRNAFNYA